MRIALSAKRVKSAADADYGHLPSVRVTAQAVHFKKNWGGGKCILYIVFFEKFFYDRRKNIAGGSEKR